MTEDTIFDMASLTKPLATAPAVMQLYEQGKVQFDDPVQKYLPDFNTANDPLRAEVTVRMLLTHTSGETGDVDLKDPWGLDGPIEQKAFVVRSRTPLESSPVRGSATPTSTSSCSACWSRSSQARQKTIYVQQNVLRRLAWKRPAICPRPKRVVRTR